LEREFGIPHPTHSKETILKRWRQARRLSYAGSRPDEHFAPLRLGGFISWGVHPIARDRHFGFIRHVMKSG
jgi:hypothetical protein